MMVTVRARRIGTRTRIAARCCSRGVGRTIQRAAECQSPLSGVERRKPTTERMRLSPLHANTSTGNAASHPEHASGMTTTIQPPPS